MTPNKEKELKATLLERDRLYSKITDLDKVIFGSIFKQLNREAKNSILNLRKNLSDKWSELDSKCFNILHGIDGSE